jgi:hypothetical protein
MFSHYCRTADYDRDKWLCVRRVKGGGHNQNCHKPYETQWLLEFIDRSKLKHLNPMALKGKTAVAVKKVIPHNHVDLPPLVSVQVTLK